MSKTITTFEDLSFTVVAELGENELHVSFKVLDIEGHTEDMQPLYEPQEGAPHNASGYVDTTDPLHAAPYINGSVKWDGCSNWLFDDQVGGNMLHGCSRRDIQRYGDVLGRCWDMAGEMMGKNWRPC